MRTVQMLRAMLVTICCVLAGSAAASVRTTSPDGRYVVFATGGHMFIKRLGTHKLLQVGRRLPGPCCELVTVLPSEAWRADVELHDGAFWTKRTVRWTNGRRFVLVRMGDVYWFLAMDGQLRGDV
jgi:hypothetical protein